MRSTAEKRRTQPDEQVNLNINKTEEGATYLPLPKTPRLQKSEIIGAHDIPLSLGVTNLLWNARERMGTRIPSLYTSCFHWIVAPASWSREVAFIMSIAFSSSLLHGTDTSAPQLISIHTCRLQFSRLSPALHSALLWIMPGFGRFDSESSTSWPTIPLRWISCRSFDAYANMHVTAPCCPVASGQANRSNEDFAVLVEKVHAYARSSIERRTSSEGSWSREHTVKVKPTTREAFSRVVWWLTPSKEPRSGFRSASHASQTLSL